MLTETKVFVGQKAFINKNGKVLVLRDPDYTIEDQSGLDFPGGRFRWGNDLIDELKREVKEETGLEIKVVQPFVTWTNKKTGRRSKRINIVLIGYLCEYISGDVVLSDEHNYYEWVDYKDYKKWKDDTEYFEALEKYFKLVITHK